jgi:uncharacterized protein (TIGR03437 family)
MHLSCFVLILLPALPAQAQQANVASRTSDLNYIATQVPRLDPYFFAHLDRVQFQRAVDDLNARLSTISDAEFYVGLAQLLAMAGDAHTSLSLLSGSFFPLQYRWLDDGIFVRSAAADYSRALGAQLVAIGGLPIDQVVQRLATVISHENDQGVRSTAERYLRSQLVLEGLDIVPAAPTSDFTFRTLAGSEFTLQIGTESPPMLTMPDWSQGAVPNYLQAQNRYYRLTYSSSNRLLYFKYNLCANMTPTFESFAATLLQILDTNPVDTLAFDFRGNPGGDNMVSKPLLDGFQQRLPRLVSNPNFRAYVVFDKGSFSSAVDNAMRLKSPALWPGMDLSKVIQSIGEPAGQAPEMFGNTVQFNLPGSQMIGWYATKFFPRPSWIPAGPELVPDIPIRIRSTDYFARFDPVMAAMLARSSGAPASPSGDVITVNAASLRPDQGLAPGSFAAAFGSFSTTPDEVQVAGIPGQIVTASRSQVNFILPDSVAPGRVSISVRADAAELASGEATITATGPGLFVSQPADPSQPGAVENEDHSVVRLFATGSGAADPAAVRVFFADIPAEVIYSGAVMPGVWEIDVQVPNGVSGPVPVYLIDGNLASNGVTVWVQ